MQRLDVQRFLDEQPFSGFQWRIWGLCFAVVLLDGFDTAAVGFIAPSLLGEWGIGKPELGPVMSAGLFGLAGGALLAGPLADRLGRKLVLTVSVFLFGLASLASAFSPTVDVLAALRLVTGLGLGAAMPNAVTLMNEYCPTHRRATLTNAMFCGFPLGAALGGFLARWIIPAFGWRSVLILGGVAPLLLAVAIVVGLPESVRYLIAKKAPDERVRTILARVSARVDAGAVFTSSEAPAKSGVGVVLSSRYLLGSLMLWVAYFMGLVVFYAMINWLPILLRDAGVEPGAATLIAALFPLGGLGAVFAGWLMDRFDADRIVAVLYALTAVSIYALGQSTGNIGLLVVVVFVAGTAMNTAQSSLPSLAAAFYPTHGRATGVAWMMGVGRFGGVLGSWLVGALSGVSLGGIFTAVALPGLLAAFALWVKQAGRASASAAPALDPAGE